MPTNTHTVLGGTKRFECRVIGHPRPQIRWFKDGRDITNNERYGFDHTMDGTISMIIKDISHKDQGHYRCRAENSEGFASTSAYLLVKAHKEHADEEIETVHAMEIDEHIVFKKDIKRANYAELHKEDNSENEASRKRTFKEAVIEEKENIYQNWSEVKIKDTVAHLSDKKFMDSSTVSKVLTEERSIINQHTTEQDHNKIHHSKKLKNKMEGDSNILTELSEIKTSSVRVHRKSSLDYTDSLQISEASSESPVLTKSREVSLRSEENRDQETKLKFSSSVGTTRESLESNDLHIGVSMVTVESSSAVSRSKALNGFASCIDIVEKGVKEPNLTLTADVVETQTSSEVYPSETSKASTDVNIQYATSVSESEKDNSEKYKVDVSVESSGSEICTRETLEHARSSISEETEIGKNSISAEISTWETLGTASNNISIETEIDKNSPFEIREECRLDLVNLEKAQESQDLSQDLTDVALTSLCNDSGFAETSLLESSQFLVNDSIGDIIPSEPTLLNSPVVVSTTDLITPQTGENTQKQGTFVKELDIFQTELEILPHDEADEAKANQIAAALETVVQVTKEVSVVRETSDHVSLEEVTEIEARDKFNGTYSLIENGDISKQTHNATSHTGSVVESVMPENTVELPQENISETLHETASMEENLKVKPDSQTPEMSHTETTSSDITGLLDEKCKSFTDTVDTVSFTEEVVVAEQIDDEHLEYRVRWVDQIDARTETICMVEGDKKISKLKTSEELSASETLSESTQQTSVQSTDVSRTEALEVQANEEIATIIGNESIVTRAEIRESSVDPEPNINLVQTTLAANEEELTTLRTEVEISETKEKKSEVQDDITFSFDVDVQHNEKKVTETLKVNTDTPDGASFMPPCVVLVPDDVSVEVGQAIRLVSQVQGNPLPEVKWFKEGDTVKAGERITLHTEDDVFTLEINSATFDDAGTYTLTAHNSQGTIFSDVLVMVTIPPSIGPADEEFRVTARLSIPEFVVRPSNVTVRELGTLELVCTIRGNPSPAVVWSKDGKTLQADNHLRIFESEGQYYLEIPKVSADDAGEYTCTASNSEGSISCSIAVFIESKESSVSFAEDGSMVPSGQRESSSDELFLRTYEMARAFQDTETSVSLAVGDSVEVLDSRQKSGMWLVRNRACKEQVCFVPSSCLRGNLDGDINETAVRRREPKPPRSPTNRLSSSERDAWIDTSEDEDRTRLRESFPIYVVIADFNPPQVNGELRDTLKLTEGQIVEVMDMERVDRWLVQTRPTKTCVAKQGWVPSAYLEAKTTTAPMMRRSTREVFREDVLQISNKQQEAVLKRSAEMQDGKAFSAKYAVTELVESEREYIRELQHLLDCYYKRLSRRNTPSVLKGKRDLIFSNVSDILDFHNDTFLRVLQTSSANPGTIGDCFLIKEKKFMMYISYWIDHLSSAIFLETEEAQEFLKEYSRSIGESELALVRLLATPLERLRTYQALLKDILRYTVRAGEDCTSLEKAIAMLAFIELQVKHQQLLQSIENLPGDISNLGQLIRHDDAITWDGDTQTSRAKDRHIFLFRDKLLITKKRKGDATVDRPAYVFKNLVDLQDIQVNENVAEDDRRFELWYATAATEKLTVQARHLATKHAWLKDIRELLRAIGVEETDIMPEKNVSDGSPTHSSQTTAPKRRPSEKSAVTAHDSESDSDRTLTDGDYASLSSYESDISSYHTAPEFEDGTSRPVFKRRPKKTICQEGGTVRFDCFVGGTPLPVVKWLKDGATIKESETVQIISDGETSTLVLISVCKHQSGQYTALAANHNGSVLAATELVVLEELGGEKAESVPEQTLFGAQEPGLLSADFDREKTPSAEKLSPPVKETENTAEVKVISKEELTETVKEFEETKLDAAAEAQEIVAPKETAREEPKQFTGTKEIVTEVPIDTLGELKIHLQEKGVITEEASSYKQKEEVLFTETKFFSVEEEQFEELFTKKTKEPSAEETFQQGDKESQSRAKRTEEEVAAAEGSSREQTGQNVSRKLTVSDSEQETKLKEPKNKDHLSKQDVQLKEKSVKRQDLPAELRIEYLTEQTTEELSKEPVKQIKDLPIQEQVISSEENLRQQELKENLGIKEEPKRKVNKQEGKAVQGDKSETPSRTEEEVKENSQEASEKPKQHKEAPSETTQLQPELESKKSEEKEDILIKETQSKRSFQELASEKDSLKRTETKSTEDFPRKEDFQSLQQEAKQKIKESEKIKLSQEKNFQDTLIAEVLTEEKFGVSTVVGKTLVPTTQITFTEETSSHNLGIWSVAVEETKTLVPETSSAIDGKEIQNFEKKLVVPVDKELLNLEPHTEATVVEANNSTEEEFESKETPNEEYKQEPSTNKSTEEEFESKEAPKEEYKQEPSTNNNNFKPILEGTQEGGISLRAPYFLSEMNDVVVELGQLARFDCRVAAYPDPEITWLKDGRKVVPTDRYVLQNFHDDIFSLLIKDVKVEDSGFYTCMARNEYGEAKSEALLNVLSLQDQVDQGDMAPSFATKFGNVECIEGVPVEFTCQINGRPPPSVTWLINGHEVSPSLDILTRQQENTVMLAFRSVQLEDSGDIVCKLKNHLGEATCRAKLRVNEDLSKKGECPLFVERPTDMEVTEGGEAKFECVVTGRPEPTVLWYFNGRELFESHRRIIRKKGDKYSLTLREVIPDNAGVYTCKAVNAAGDASCAVELAVKEIPKDEARAREAGKEITFSFPPTFTRRLLDQRVAPGRSARFECLMLGVPLPEVEWQKAGHTLKASDKYKIGREGSTAILEIDNVDTNDEGEYVCILYNDAGKATSKAGLLVQEERKPKVLPSPKLEAYRPERAPSKGREEYAPPVSRPLREYSPEEKVPTLPFDKPSLLNIQEDSVQLNWLPARTSNLPDNARRITYTIEAREMPSNRWTRLASDLEGTSYLARNLHPDKEYLFRVYAENKYGPSEPTLPATLSFREEPEDKRRRFAEEELPAPLKFPTTKPYVMDIGDETLRLGWHPAEVDRHRMERTPVSYRVEAQKLPSEEWVPLASRVRDTSLYLSDLESDRDYNVRVRAQGPYGISQPTEPVWLPRATAFTGVPVSRPQITELEPDSVRLQWRRVDVPAFSREEEPLLYMIEMQEPPSTRWREVASRISDNYYIVRDLEPATDYRFRVRAETLDGLRSEPSPATSIYRTLALSRSPVDQLEITDYEPDYESVGLSWRRVEIPPYDHDDEPLMYMIEFQEPQADAWRPLVSGVPTTRYRVPDIGPTQDYQFRVRALTPYGTSPPSHPAGLYRHTSPMRPLAQDLYISSLEPDSMRLSWQSPAFPSSHMAPSQPISYQIEALEYPSSQWHPVATDVRDTTYQLSGLKPTKDYSFRIRSVTPSGVTEPSSPVTVTSLPVRPRLPMKEPTIIQMGADSARLQWRPAELPYYMRHTTPITYTVEMQEVPGYTWTPVRRNIPETTYQVTGLRSDRDYRFRIRPETEYGSGEYSLPVHAYRRPAVTLPTREPVISDVGLNSILLTWLPAKLPSGIQTTRPVHYRIEMREPPSGQWVPVADRIKPTSYSINFLNPDKDYLFRVFAELDGVESEPTSSVFLPHRMGPPKMLREPPLISAVRPDSVSLSWRSVDIPSRITDYAPVTYRIEAQEPPLTEWRPLARRIPHTHYVLTGLKPSQEYSFRIRAENDFGLSEPTPTVNLRKRSVPPVMPQHEPLISDVSPGSLRLSWRPAAMPMFLVDSVPVSYSIHYQHLPDLDWHPLARRIQGTCYYITGLSPDNNYNFRVQAENDFGTSMPTFPARMPRLADIPSPIYSPEIEEVEPAALRLAWKIPKTGPYKSKKTTYSIETLEPSSWTWQPLVSQLPTPSYRVTSLSPTQDYVFRIRAEADKTLSEPSFPISYSRSRGPPSVPVERPILSEIEPDSVRVSWHPYYFPTSSGLRDGNRRYRLEMRELPYDNWRTLVPHTADRSYDVTGLRPDSDYAFRVRLITDEGESPPSNSAFLYRQSVVSHLSLKTPELEDVYDDGVSLRWNRVDVPAFDGDEEPLSFMVEAQHLPSYEWEPLARGITDNNYRVHGLQPQQDYVFRVRGELSSGITVPSSPVPLYRRPERAGVPISYVTIDDRNVPPYSAYVRWKPVYIPPYTSPSNTTYLVEMRESPHRNWRTLVSDVNNTEYLVSDLSPRKSYMFRVRAKSPAGDLSEPSLPVPFYPLYMRGSFSESREYLPLNEDFSLPNRPYIHTLVVKVPPRMHIEKPDLMVISPDKVHLTWNPARVPPATSALSPTTYRVEVREDGSFNWVERASGIAGLACDVTGLNPHVDFAFRVRAVNDFGWSEATLPVFLHRPLELTYEEPDFDWESYSPAVPSAVAPRMPIDSPRITQASNDSLKLSWHPARIPAYAQTTPITYVVEMKEPVAQAWKPVADRLHDTCYKVSGLQPDRSYLFRVRAESEHGSSEPTLPAEFRRTQTLAPGQRSASVEKQSLTTDYDLTTRRGSFIDSITSRVPPRVPTGRPTISNATETSLTLSWPASRLPPYLKNTKLDYIIEYREPSSHLWTVWKEYIPDTSYKVTGLDPEQDYMFRVRAHNDSGTSEPTLPASLEREKKKSSTTPRRSGSSVDRRSLERHSEDRKSLDRQSLSRRSESLLGRRDSAKRVGEEADLLLGMSPDDTPMAPVLCSKASEDIQYGVESHPMKISLQLRGYPPPQVSWYHEGKLLELGDRYDTYVTPGGQVFLEFLNMGWPDVGKYKCVAENEHGKAEKIITVDVADPPTFIEPLRDVTVVEHGQTKLSCSVDGIPYPSVRFMKDWRPLTDSSHLSVNNDPNHPECWALTIRNAIVPDAGNYVCVAENVAGKVFCTGKVSVVEAPVEQPLGYKEGNLEDNYYVLQEIGRGRHAIVRRVIEKSTGKEFAAKFIQVRDAADKEFFRCELEMLGKLNYKNVLSVYDAYETPRQLIIVTELLSGGELLECAIKDGDWSEGKAASVIKQLLETLQHVHACGIVHLDVKPSNLLLAGPTIDSTKLIDFGLARKISPSEDTFLNHGTPGFVSPEAVGVKPISTASDVWGVGVLAYILLGGQSPFQADSIADSLKKIQGCDWSFDNCKTFASISQDARDFISQILKKNPDERLTVDECLTHPWLNKTSTSAKLDVAILRNFQEKDKSERQETATKTASYLCTLQRLLAGSEAFERALCPVHDPTTGSLTFPDTEAYGEFLDSESWYDWQARYGHGPDSGLVPLKDPEYTARVRGYQRSADGSSLLALYYDDEGMGTPERERHKMMKERRLMADIDKEEIPPSLKKELEFQEERKQAKKTRDITTRQDSLDSRRSSISVEGEAVGPIPVFRHRLQDLTFQTGDTITMYCALEGQAPYSTVWYKNEELLSDGSRVKQELSADGQATLTITAAKPYDAGIYKCIARTKAGRATTKMRLLQGDVPERPGRPVAVQVAASEVVIIWEAPHIDGNFPIQYYRLDFKAKDDNRWTIAAYSLLEMCLVSGLQPETSYRFRVSAVNLLGRGPFSWSSVEIMTRKEGSVTALTTGDMDLQLLKRRQAEGEEMAHKHRDQAEPEPDIISEGADITLQAGSFEAQFVPGNLLWKGHFGEVRDCTDKKTSKRYIIKVTSPDIEESVHEFNILKGLRHETILCLLAAFSTPSAIFLIFEFVPGEHAAQRLSLRRRYSEESVAYIIRQVLHGLQYLHQNQIVHLNLQPSALLLCGPHGLDLKLSDFSLAQIVPGPEGLQVPRKGFPDFIAPEVVAKEIVSFSSDIWGVGTLTFLLLSGLSPFSGASDEETLINVAYSRYDAGDLYEGVSSEALKFLYKLMKRLPRNRPSVQECLEHKWLQLTDTIVKLRESNLFLNNRLRKFVLEYDTRRQQDDRKWNFDELLLPSRFFTSSQSEEPKSETTKTKEFAISLSSTPEVLESDTIAGKAEASTEENLRLSEAFQAIGPLQVEVKEKQKAVLSEIITLTEEMIAEAKIESLLQMTLEEPEELGFKHMSDEPTQKVVVPTLVHIVQASQSSTEGIKQEKEVSLVKEDEKSISKTKLATDEEEEITKSAEQVTEAVVTMAVQEAQKCSDVTEKD